MRDGADSLPVLMYNGNRMSTNTHVRDDDPAFFRSLPHFSDEINHNIVKSEIEGGVYLSDLPEGTKLEIQTENRYYRLKICTGGEAIICGHPEFCPQPVTVKINGSSWGGSMLKVAFIGRGMHLEFRHPVHKVITTSPIVDIRSVK